ncbi:MAG: hypothetical protein J0I14_06765 [Propionibacteriaceae bacterium]|nr:hypothetical protein [Propionibacteriaceae bacterium]
MAESIVVVLAAGLSLTMVAAAGGKALRLLPSSLWPKARFREGRLLVVPEFFAVVVEVGLVWLLWVAPVVGFVGSAALFSVFNVYLAWLVSRGVKRCNCFGPPTAITQNKLATNYGVSIVAATGAMIAGPALSIFQCAIGLLMLAGFVLFVWSSRFIARSQEHDAFRQPPIVGASVEDVDLPARCLVLFVTPECSGCDLVLERVRHLEEGGYPRYVVIDSTAPESLRSSARSKVGGSGLIPVDDVHGAVLQERLGVRIFPSTVAIDGWVSRASGISVDGLEASHASLVGVG